MPLNIDNYSTWANARLGDSGDVAASLNPAGQGLADIRTTTNGWARFFGTSSFRAARDAVRADFQRALGERFGSRIASAVMKGVGPDLTAGTIRNAVAMATRVAMQTALTPTNGRCFKLTDGDLTITQTTINGMTHEGRAALTKFLRASCDANGILGDIPTGAAQLDDMAQRTDAAVRTLIDAKVSVLKALADDPAAHDETSFRRVAAHCDALVRQLQAHLAHVRDLNAAGPMSQASQDRFRDTWFDAFKGACIALKAKVPGNDAALRALDDLALVSHDQFNSTFRMSKDFGKFLGAVIDQALKDACGRNPLPKDAAKKAIAKSYEQVLNARPWTPIAKTFDASQAGQTFSLTSTITPGKHVAGVGESYPAGVNGFMCHSAAEKNHAVNLAVSSLTVTDGPGAPRTVFTGVRHGVHCAWEIPDAGQRAEANKNRATDAVKAAFTAYLSAHPNLAPGSSVTLPMTSVSLLTPDFARDLFSGDKDNEKRMLREQTAAWNAVNNQPLQVTVNGNTYTVTPQVATFNFGVNQGGVGKLSGLFGGWGVSEPMNKAAFQTLRVRAEAFCHDANQPVAKRLAAQKLFNQLSDILANKAERSDGHDAYKAAARVAVLTSLMDGVPCWNCKSGKDRTGELDVECKFLATLIDRGLDIPEPGAELTSDQKTLFRTIALEGGNHEMQEYNTGIGGFKTGGVDSIPERLGGSEARAFHKGAADFVAV